MYDADRFQIGVVHGMRIARAAITPAASDCTLVDVSATPKRLLAGAGAARWLDAHGVVAPRAVMQWQRLGGDGAVVRVHRDRYLMVADAASAAPAPVFAAAPGPQADVLVLDHEAAEFALLGGTAGRRAGRALPLGSRRHVRHHVDRDTPRTLRARVAPPRCRRHALQIVVHAGRRTVLVRHATRLRGGTRRIHLGF